MGGNFSGDVCAQAPSGLISSATGSFDSVTGVTNESGQYNGTGPAVADNYSLQLNMNFFPSTFAGGLAGCQGWEQFVFSSYGTSSEVLIQYWLINYGTNSPGHGWTRLTNTLDWSHNSMSSAVPNQPLGNLGQLSLSGTVSADGDSVILSTGEQMYAVAGDNAVNAAAGWNTAQFGVYGNGGGGEANFNSGSTIVVRTQIAYGGIAPPTCVVAGWTAERNNLNFGPTAPSGPLGPEPALLVSQSSAGYATASCDYATAVAEGYWVDFNTGQNPPAGNGTCTTIRS